MSRLMSIAVPGTGSPAPGFETPLAMLVECHRRVQDQCATLHRLVPHLAAHGSDRAAAEAARAVMRYFDLAAPNHHADEEDDLFPALRESMAGSDAVCLREIIDGLLNDHQALEGHWLALRAVLQQVIDGAPVRLDPAAVTAFSSHYGTHIAREEGELFPMAERLLSAQVLEDIGLSMRRRRGEKL